MTINIVLPINIKFVNWASQIRMDLPTFDIPTIDDIEGWHGWASQIVTSNSLSYVPVPTKLAYPENEDWRLWAAYFVNSVYN